VRHDSRGKRTAKPSSQKQILHLYAAHPQFGSNVGLFALNKLFKPNQMGLTASSISILARSNLRENERM
jgi:hypothetical protein